MTEQRTERLIIQRVLAMYGLSGARTSPPQKGYRNTSYPLSLAGSIKYNVIFYKNEPGICERIKRTNDVSDFAASYALPTRRTLGKIIRLSTPSRETFACLYTYLPGDTIPWEAYTKNHIKVLGMGLSHLHAALKEYPNAAATLPHVSDECLSITSRMLTYFADTSVQKAMKHKLQLTAMLERLWHYPLFLKACAHLPNRQALHMDFVRGNVLFTSSAPQARLACNKVAISGILDFEKTAYGHPLFDIARTLAFLLVDCKHKDGLKVQKYFLESGYIRRGPTPLGRLTIKMQSRTYDTLEELTTFFLLYDFYKFLCHNPYESLHQNEHFMRTRDILIRRKLLE